MNPKDDYMPIADFSRFAGISPAAIYKRLNTGDAELLTHIKLVKDKKHINKAALSLFNCPGIQPVDNQLITSYQLSIDLLTGELDARNTQLEKKDEQISGYITQIAELNEHLRNQTQLVQESHYIAAAGQKQIEDASIEPVKKSFWDRFKRKGR